MKKNVGLLLVLLWLSIGISAQVIYTKKDSVRIESLIDKGHKLAPDVNRPLYFAKQFLGVPYGAATLETGNKEQLVVCLDKMDCLTLVETVMALTFSSRSKSPGFKSFCDYLRTIRYKDGTVNGYLSRLHYFSSWIDNNTKWKLVREISDSPKNKPNPYQATQTMHINYMTQHPANYPALRKDPAVFKGIRAEERKLSGRIVPYIPAVLLDRDSNYLSTIHNGDILAIVTRRRGLDVSHLGFAVWKNGTLHLLNASSLRKKVVLETRSLRAYMRTQRNQMGVRVIRIL